MEVPHWEMSGRGKGRKEVCGEKGGRKEGCGGGRGQGIIKIAGQ